MSLLESTKFATTVKIPSKLLSRIRGVYSVLFLPILEPNSPYLIKMERNHFHQLSYQSQRYLGFLHPIQISQESQSIVTVHEDKKHGLVDGDVVKFAEVKGMEELNFIKEEKNVFTVKEIGKDIPSCFHPSRSSYIFYRRYFQIWTI